MSESQFWGDLQESLQDAATRQQYILESQRIAAIDNMVNRLNDAREQLGMSKAELGRAIERTPETIRRLLTSRSINPQYTVVVEMAAALGLKLDFRPMTATERREVAEPLRQAGAAVAAHRAADRV